MLCGTDRGELTKPRELVSLARLQPVFSTTLRSVEEQTKVPRLQAGSAIATATRIWLANLLPFSLVALLLNLPFIAWAFYATNSYDPVTWNARMSQYQTGSIVGLFLVASLVCAVVTHGTLQQLRGTRISIFESLRATMLRVVPVVGVTIVTTLATGLASLLLLLPGIVVFTTYLIVIPVTLAERLGVRASMRRSAELTVGNRMQIFFAVVVVFAVQFGLHYLFFQFTSLPTDQQFITQDDLPQRHLMIPLLRAVGQIVMTLGSVLPAVIYEQLRIAKEGGAPLAAARALR